MFQNQNAGRYSGKPGFCVTTPNVTAPENSAFNEQRYDSSEVTLFDGSLNPIICQLSDQSLKCVEAFCGYRAKGLA